MSYRDKFDHFGQPRSADFRLSDLVICSIAFAVIAAFFSGVLS